MAQSRVEIFGRSFSFKNKLDIGHLLQRREFSETKSMKLRANMTIITVFGVVAFLVMLQGCANQVIVTSQPSEVDTTVYNPKTGAHYYLGKTPLKIPYSLITKEIGEVDTSGSLLLYSFNKEKYEDKRLYLPASRWNSLETVINVELELAKNQQDKNAQARELIQYLLNAESFLQQGIFDRARFEVERALKIDPYFSWSHILLGNVNYFEKKYDEALKSFEKALEFDPQNNQALKMIPIVREKLEASK